MAVKSINPSPCAYTPLTRVNRRPHNGKGAASQRWRLTVGSFFVVLDRFRMPSFGSGMSRVWTVLGFLLKVGWCLGWLPVVRTLREL